MTVAELSAFFDRAVSAPTLVEVLPDGSGITFELSGEGGGTWSVLRSGETVAVRRAPLPWPDCTLACSVRDFQALLNGDLNSRDGFLSGRLVVTGDVGLVLAVERLFATRPD